ncbi:phospholipid/glycerol acyltransferase [Thioploca ingrica]|uniref:Phospholipid/glycerol acyltransferase n=1 Tax=Thioploca ingrica TaxID=40754 RepID=A0A090AER0_9GAMM|nr:phospholipid/glycerol acyltransferase [Thioploca ingrica]
MILFLRSLLFYVGVILAILVFAPLSLMILPLPYPQRYRVMTKWGLFVIWWLRKTCNLNYQVYGLENLPTTAAIVLSKHQSAWETIAFQQIFPTQVWLLKRELFWIPLFGWALATLNPIAINRRRIHQSMQYIIEQGKQRLAQGLWIIIFPEGTRVAPGQQQRYGIGGALLAAQSGYPVVLVAHNSGQFWPSRGFIKRPGTIQVIIGPRLESTGKSAKEINLLAENWIEETMQRFVDN